MAELRKTEQKARPSATPVDELEAEVTRIVNAGTGLTRELVVMGILMNNADLARRLKRFIEEQDGGREKALRAISDRAIAVGLEKGGGAAAELDWRARARMQKGDESSRFNRPQQRRPREVAFRYSRPAVASAAGCLVSVRAPTAGTE